MGFEQERNKKKPGLLMEKRQRIGAVGVLCPSKKVAKNRSKQGLSTRQVESSNFRPHVKSCEMR